MPLSREPSLRNWMKWSSSSDKLNASPAAANNGPAEIIHLGGSRLEAPLIVLPATTPEDRRLTAWPCGPPPVPPPAGLARAKTDAAALGRRQQSEPETAEPTTKSHPPSLTLRPAPGRSQDQNVDSFAFMSPPMSATTGYHASFFPQRPQEPEDDHAGDRSPASTASVTSSRVSSVRPPPPLRTRDALASPLTPATSVASAPKTAPLQINTDSFYFGEASPDMLSVVSSPGGRRPLHTKSPSHSGHFPARSSSKGPNSQPKHLRRSRSAVDNNRKYQGEQSPMSTSQDAQDDRGLTWPLSPIPFEDGYSQTSPSSPSGTVPPPSSADVPQVVVVDYPPPRNSPPKRPLPKIISIPAPYAERKKPQIDTNGDERAQATTTPRQPRHTTQERLWLHRNYRGEAAFLTAWGLNIELEQDREEGKSILQELMQAEDDDVEDSLVGTRLQARQHSPAADWTNSPSTTSLDEAGLHVIEEEDTKSPRSTAPDKTPSATRYAPTNRRGGPSSSRNRVPPPRGHYRSESETSVLGSYLETWGER